MPTGRSCRGNGIRHVHAAAIMIDPAWEGTVQFYELVFGTWLAYGFLALMWDRALRCPLDEWKYVMITFLGASAFWINHYFQSAPYYSVALNTYTVAFVSAYYLLAVHGQSKSVPWRIGATLTSVIFTIAFIIFENISRFFVNGYGVNEFWFMFIAFFGFVTIILWRGRRRKNPTQNQIGSFSPET
jgi:hypothetical protein